MSLANSHAHETLVRDVLNAVYKPRLEESARHLQSVAGQKPLELRKAAVGVMPQAGTCIVFADGLRFDVAGRLQELLETRGFRVRISHRLAPVPAVTPHACCPVLQ